MAKVHSRLFAHLDERRPVVGRAMQVLRPDLVDDPDATEVVAAPSIESLEGMRQETQGRSATPPCGVLP